MALDDVLLVDRLATQHTLKAEARHVDRLGASGDDLGDSAPRGRRLLQAVAGESIAQHQVGHVWVPADDGVLVEGVVLVEARPRGAHLEQTCACDMCMCTHLASPHRPGTAVQLYDAIHLYSGAALCMYTPAVHVYFAMHVHAHVHV